SFYNHFESKEALGAEIVERYGLRGDRRAILRDKSVAPLDRLRRHYETLTNVFTDGGFERGGLLGNFSAELSTQSRLMRYGLAKVFTRWTQDLEIAIADGQADGSITSKRPAGELAAFLLDSFEGALLRARVERKRQALDRFMRFCFEQILT